ncbi:MAG: c-type cytochrome biogenesis protein CcsB [Deltaproteobacteria bacterium]
MTGIEVYGVLVKAAFGAYVLSALAAAVFFLTQRQAAGRTAFGICLAGFACHTAALAVRAILLGYPPVSNLHESLSFFGWVIILVYAVVEARRKDWVNGTFVLPLAATVTGYSLSLDAGVRPLVPALRSPWLGIHASSFLLSYACFLLAFCFGIMYLWQEREVKSRKVDTFFFRLPALQLVDRLGYRAVVFGFIFMTLGIVSGSLWAWRAWGSFWSWDPKETASLVLWCVYVAYLHGRLAAKWKGRTSALIAIGGFMLVLFTYFGVSFLLPGLHAYF